MTPTTRVRGFLALTYKHQNCVRLHHEDSKTIVTGQSNKSRQANLKEAFQNLIENAHFKVWHARKVQELLGEKTSAEIIEEMMKPQNLKIEFQDENGDWNKLEI